MDRYQLLNDAEDVEGDSSPIAKIVESPEKFCQCGKFLVFETPKLNCLECGLPVPYKGDNSPSQPQKIKGWVVPTEPYTENQFQQSDHYSGYNNNYTGFSGYNNNYTGFSGYNSYTGSSGFSGISGFPGSTGFSSAAVHVTGNMEINGTLTINGEQIVPHTEREHHVFKGLNIFGFLKKAHERHRSHSQMAVFKKLYGRAKLNLTPKNIWSQILKTGYKLDSILLGKEDKK
jgi:hypothetical protein